MRVITFSRTFPAYHPKAGQPTNFVEKIYKALFLMKVVPPELVGSFDFSIMNDSDIAPKHHTIRAGNRWKVGDKFSPRVWSGKPYNSKQIIIAPDIEIKKVWEVKIDLVDQYETIAVIDQHGNEISVDENEVAANDGLSNDDFYDWFAESPKGRKEVFRGQIICWNENVNY